MRNVTILLQFCYYFIRLSDIFILLHIEKVGGVNRHFVAGSMGYYSCADWKEFRIFFCFEISALPCVASPVPVFLFIYIKIRATG